MWLYLVRHAYAGEHGDPRYPDDSVRPLTGKGRKKFARMCRRLVERGLAPERIATSPLVRCLQTAEILAEATGCPAPAPLAALEPGSDLGGVLSWTAEQKASRVAWVGHSPDVDHLAGVLIGSGANLAFAKGAIAAIDFGPGQPVIPGRGELRWFATVKLLGG